jgi:hypothetical protein
VQIQQSHVSLPQSHPKHGFDTPCVGFLTEEPVDDGSVQFTGDAVDEVIVG